MHWKIRAAMKRRSKRAYLRPASAKRPEPWLALPSGAMLKRGVAVAAWMIAIGGSAAAVAVGVPRLQAHAAKARSVDPHAVSIRLLDAPEWCPRDLADTLLRTATLQIDSNPLDRSDLVAIRATLLETGWFESIHQVRCVDDRRIDVTARYVRPYTVIHDKTGGHLVDAGARLLPKSYEPGEPLPIVRAGDREFPIISIMGAHFRRPQRTGHAWEGADVAAAMRVLAIIKRQPWQHQVAAVDVSGFLRGAPIRIKTDRDSVIIWGGAPGAEAALELLADGKLQRLNFMYERHGRIDGGHAGEIDITNEKAVVAR